MVGICEGYKVGGFVSSLGWLEGRAESLCLEKTPLRSVRGAQLWEKMKIACALKDCYHVIMDLSFGMR